MNVYEQMINQIATEVAIKAEAILLDRVNSLGQRMLMKVFVETPEFVNSVRGQFTHMLENDPDFKSAVEDIAQRTAEEEAASAIRDHERDTDHIDVDEVVQSNDFAVEVTRVAREEAEDVLSESGLDDRIENLEDNEMFLERAASMLADPHQRRVLHTVTTTGKFDVDEHRAKVAEREAADAAALAVAAQATETPQEEKEGF